MKSKNLPSFEIQPDGESLRCYCGFLNRKEVNNVYEKETVERINEIQKDTLISFGKISS